ncbi:MAG: ribosome-inactivating family protein [Bacteroidota bacterium]
MQIRLQHGGAYSSDISSLRSAIRANGTRAFIQRVTIFDPNTTSEADMYVNLAFQPNSQEPPVNASIYTVAFGNNNGIWNFNVGNIGTPIPGNPFPGGLNGDYAGFGYPGQLPTITEMNLSAALEAVSHYHGQGPVPVDVLQGMARLIIAVNEGVRFDIVATGIESILANPYNIFEPPTDTIRDWGGHTIGS